MVKKLIVAGVVLVLVGAGAFWWFVVRDDAPPPRTLDDIDNTAVGTVPDSLDGTWTIVEGSESTAGFRINESFLNGLTDHAAVGLSEDVTGSLTVDGTQVTKGDVTVDLTGLTFTDDPGGPSVTNRANKMKGSGLETNTFPEASFELTEPVDFGAKPKEDAVVDVTLTGDLTIHGKTNPVTFDAKAKLVGDTIQVEASGVPVVLADYDIEKPTSPLVASIDDEGSFEFLVVFTKS